MALGFKTANNKEVNINKNRIAEVEKLFGDNV